MIRIQQEDFAVAEEVAALLQGNTSVGGIVTFIGTVRDYASSDQVIAMELEHYPGMTEAELEKIESAARARFDIEALLVVHRVGRLGVGENIVLVVAAARHRAAAFDACRFMIDHLKVRATFWKKEITSAGERWVDACPGCEAAASQWAELRGVAHTHAVTVQDGGHGSDKKHAHTHHKHDAGWSGVRVGILTLSDSRTLAEDRSGDGLEGLVRALGGTVVKRQVLPDQQEGIADCLRTWADGGGMEVILTTGGTGPSPRDVTPEATREVCERELVGVAELMRRRGLEETPTAVLSRGVVAVRGTTLVVNLPGSARGSAHGLGTIETIVPHILRMMHGGGHG